MDICLSAVVWDRSSKSYQRFAHRSKQIFYSTAVQTILQAAGLDVTVKETEHPGHATDIVRQLALDSCDAVVAVGGDGTVFEALQVIRLQYLVA